MLKDHLDLRFLGAHSTSGHLNLLHPYHTVSWSGDNQVALVTDGGGVTIVDFDMAHSSLQDEETGSSSSASTSTTFISHETRLSCVKPNGNSTSSVLSSAEDSKALETYTGLSLSTLLLSQDKHQIFEIVRDSLMSPKELINCESQLYYTKVLFSPRPFRLSSGEDDDKQYILAGLDSHFNFRLYRRKKISGDGDLEGEGIFEGDDWQVFIDLTESFRTLLINQFWPANITEEVFFEEYRRRMYELATVDFIWIPSWDEDEEDNKLAGFGIFSVVA